EINSKLLEAEQSNTSIIYNGKYFMKLYRKIENTINPDMELTRFLSEETTFPNVPAFFGSISLSHEDDTQTVLAMVQEAVPNQGDDWEYTKDALQRFFEAVLIQPKTEEPPKLTEDLSRPLLFENIYPEVQDLFDGVFADRISLLGKRTGEMHQAFVSVPENADFTPEAFSLHYQRSLYSSMQSLTRRAFQNLKQQIKHLPDPVKEEAEEVLNMRDKVLKVFKNIFSHKMNTMKIRNHGDFHLGQVLWTGKDFMIIDFEGEPARPYSERRLKRSPLRDVAGIVRSLHYASYSTILDERYNIHRVEDNLQEWAEVWFHHMSRFYLHGYLEQVKNENFIPDNEGDFKIMLHTYLLEKAVYELNYELNNRPDWVLIPLRGIKSILNSYKYD